MPVLFPPYDPLAALLRLERRLQRLFVHALVDVVTPRQLREVARDLDRICRHHPDAALAGLVLLDQGLYSVRHSIHVALVANLVARHQRQSEAEVQSLTAAALTMNIGLWALQDRLQRQVEPLSPEQRTEIQGHPLVSEERLRDCGVDDPLWLEAVRHHHEKLDGTGYPDQLAGSEVSYAARLLGLCDVFCAQISARAYREAIPPREAMKAIFQKQSAGLDSQIAQAVIKVLGLYPPGNWVALANGETGLVVGRGPAADKPRVLVARDPAGQTCVPVLRDTAHKAHRVLTLVPGEPRFAAWSKTVWRENAAARACA